MRGFTFLELLIVLVILVTIIAIAWPQMRKRIARNQLKQVAVDLVEVTAEAQRLAIKRGESFVLQFSESTSSYRVGPAAELQAKGIGLRESFETIQIGDQDSVQSAASDSELSLVSSVELDPSISMHVHKAAGNDEQVFETIEVGSADGFEVNNAPRRIFFFPDGRADNIEIAIHDRVNRIGISIRIRALTGKAEVGEAFKLVIPDNQDASQDSPKLDADSDLKLEAP